MTEAQRTKYPLAESVDVVCAAIAAVQDHMLHLQNFGVDLTEATYHRGKACSVETRDFQTDAQRTQWKSAIGPCVIGGNEMKRSRPVFIFTILS